MADATSLIESVAAEITVLIPAVGPVSEGTLTFSNVSCSAMIPVAGRPVIHWTISYLLGLGIKRFLIGVARRGMYLEDYVDCAFGPDCSIDIVVPNAHAQTEGLGRTVMELGRCVTTRRALIVLGDTYFQFEDPSILLSDSPLVLVSPVAESFRWCTAESNAEREVVALQNKVEGLPTPLEALIGVYYFPDVGLLNESTHAASDGPRKQHDQLEMVEVLDQVRAREPLHTVVAGDWFDCGNTDTLGSSQRVLLQKRDFNELTIDSLFGTITKRSQNVEKFINEIDYIRLLPKELKVLFPRYLDFSTAWEDPWVVLEYYGYPTLAEVFVFHNVDPGIWEGVFDRLHDIIGLGFMRFRRPLHEGDIEKMYLGKTRKRLERLVGPPELKALVAHDGEVVLNGKPVANLPQLTGRITAAVQAMNRDATASIIHGDLCFSNVLYDLRSQICKLIDPRGSFGRAGIYGDPRYDIAKLYHSVRGRYDFIMNNLFRVSLVGNRLDFEVRYRPQHERILERFERVFFPHFDRREILLITALLFASMPTLHYDAPNRQIAMYGTALELLDEYFEGGG
jgi:dTDP-glucose pyrophosphorylase